MKKQGGRWICTDLHLMCITQAHLTKKPNICQLPWPNVQIPVAFTYMLWNVDNSIASQWLKLICKCKHLVSSMIQQFNPRSTSK